ncbi:uncharacterized protein BDV17DRAFT_281926 [Aspergillus undulatus]|uniref:uncharacterized protein n=1 Tax=Aspergillus undulatus TaxID=1810928 RepID=UPI003CCDC5E4
MGHVQKVLVRGQALSDGISVDSSDKRIFWTNMGVPGKNDGVALSANLDGTDSQTIVAHGTIDTPKQLALDTASKEDAAAARDARNWCIGITIAPSLGKFYWTQKGPSKGGRGVFSLPRLRLPRGRGSTRDDIQVILGGLPEPVDLAIHEETRTFYCTDRGELPLGNSLNRVRLDDGCLPVASTSRPRYEVLSRNLTEAIGLELDLPGNRIFLTDLDSKLYQCDVTEITGSSHYAMRTKHCPGSPFFDEGIGR